MNAITVASSSSACCKYERLPTNDFVVTSSMYSSSGNKLRPASTGVVAVMPVNVFGHGKEVSTVNKMGIAGEVYNATLDGEWDKGGLCGCCLEGRGCNGFMRFIYASACLCCAQTEVSTMINELKGRKAMQGNTVFAQAASRTSDKNDDNAITSLYAIDLQEDFDDKNKLSVCYLSAMSFACPACMLTWVWNTAEKMLPDARKYKVAMKKSQKEKQNKMFGIKGDGDDL